MTKAETLVRLKEVNDGINILPIKIIRINEFRTNKDRILDETLRFARGEQLIVRSSSRTEDTEECSNAGKFKSLLNVEPCREEINNAIEDVYASYGTDADEEILIQPMLEGVRLSGVVFTRDMNTGAEYYVVNYHKGKETDAVTGGK